MYWISEAQTTHWDDPVFDAGEIWSHYLYNIVIWEGVLQHSGKESLTSIPRSSANQSRKGRKNPEPGTAVPGKESNGNQVPSRGRHNAGSPPFQSQIHVFCKRTKFPS
jgi:hypothetical protein